MKVTHEINEHGRHRIAIDGVAYADHWTLYSQPTIRYENGRTFIAFTEYFADGRLPTETVLELVPVQ